MKNKKAQMKIQRMAFMIMAVFLFFVLVGLVIVKVKFSELHESATELEEKNAMLLSTKIANSPEFSCGDSFGTSKGTCVDADKVMMLKQNIKDYEKFWGVSNIEIRKIYPKSNKEIICNLDNYPDCNLIKIYDKDPQGYSMANFVSLCRKENSENGIHTKCELAKISVSYNPK